MDDDKLKITNVTELEQPYQVIHCNERNELRIRADLMIPIQSFEATFFNTKFYGHLCYVLVKEVDIDYSEYNIKGE